MIEQAKVRCEVAASPARVWEVLTSKAGMKAYMMGADVEADWRPGGKLAIHGEYKGRRFEDHGEVRTFEPERQLAYTHVSGAQPDEPHLVRFELEAKDKGTKLTVTQEGGQPASSEQRAIYEKTWETMLEALSEAAAG